MFVNCLMSVQASLREQKLDEERRRRKELEEKDARQMRLAMEQSMEQMQYQKVLARSFYGVFCDWF